MTEVLEVISAGGGCSVQDLCRPGWKHFGVPEGGAMDQESAIQANRLVGNAEGAPVLEFCLIGARLKVLKRTEFALTGADVTCSHPQWRSFSAPPGEEICLGALGAGVWSYLSVRGGFLAPRWLGSASANPRAGFGTQSQPGEKFAARPVSPSGAVAGRFIPEDARPCFTKVPVFSVWPGPEWEAFESKERSRIEEEGWQISRHCDRTGFRLEGPTMSVPHIQMLSSPLRIGTIQVPPSGNPIVISRDGPTVGGYPRLAMIDPSALSRFFQCAPGTQVRFQLVK